MDNLDTSLLRTFITLAQTKSFTQTAQKMGRSQSAISMQMVKLEELINVKLFHRDKRNVTLSPDGENLLGHAKQIVALSDSFIERCREPDIEGEIHFGSPEDFATFYLPHILAKFAQSHPRVALRVNCNLTLDLLKDFDEGRYDLVVIKQQPGQLHPQALPLWRERLVWVGSSPAEKRLSFSEIVAKKSPLPLILSPTPCVYRARVLEALDRQGIAWKEVYTSPSIAGEMAAVKSGLGYAALPRKMVTPELTPLEDEWGWPKLEDAEICLLARDQNNPTVSSLAEYIQEHISFNQLS